MGTTATYACSGVFVTTRDILTAASCFSAAYDPANQILTVAVKTTVYPTDVAGTGVETPAAVATGTAGISRVVFFPGYAPGTSGTAVRIAI